ncbi:hypothetical protein GQ42DRAFT_127625 [Ramicandelaber brevisporus]|nr:hypothetical protein GQ42DRAFT_127625 [Ramicandelaber brevisporus]
MEDSTQRQQQQRQQQRQQPDLNNNSSTGSPDATINNADIQVSEEEEVEERTPTATATATAAAAAGDDDSDSIGIRSDDEFIVEEPGQVDVVELLCTLAAEHTRRVGFIHRHVQCDMCQDQIVGIRFKCINCHDYDLCEKCEAIVIPGVDVSQYLHPRSHLFMKIRTPLPVRTNPRTRTVEHSLYPVPDQTAEMIKYPIPAVPRDSDVRKLIRTTHYLEAEIRALYEIWSLLSPLHLCGITFDTFKLCMGRDTPEKHPYVRALFKAFDIDGDGLVNFYDLVSSMSIISRGSLEEKIDLAVRFYTSSNGEHNRVTRGELILLLRSYTFFSMMHMYEMVKVTDNNPLATHSIRPSQPISAAFNVEIPAHDPLIDQFTNANSTNSAGSFQIYPSSMDLTDSVTNSAIDSDTEGDELDEAFAREVAELGGPSVHLDAIREWPVLNKVARRTVKSIVNDVFSRANAASENYLTEEEFREYLRYDQRLILWIEQYGLIL